jgi:pyrroline-5-carboxylate reductase
MNVGFIGLGNMASAIVGGMIENKVCAASDIWGSDIAKEACSQIAGKFGINIGSDNKDVAARADVLFLAVKPLYAHAAISEIKDVVGNNTVIISIIAGKSIEFLTNEFGKSLKIVRTMPNTPALVGEGCTGISCNEQVTTEETQLVLKIFQSFGKASLVPESLIDVVVGVSGSAPAYVFIFIEAMADAAVLAGMPRKQAYEFAAQAVLGSAKMVLETGKHPGELKDMVCSPGGTTIEAVKVLEQKGFRGAVMDAIQASIEKSKKL